MSVTSTPHPTSITPVRRDGTAWKDVDTDVVVIGAGHNGLVAANYLVDGGLQVTVVEANASVGGMTSCGRPIAGAPDHVVNNYSVDAFFWDAFPPSRELGLEQYGLERVVVDPGHVYLHPDGASIAFWQDARRTADEIRHFSPEDATAYLEFARVLNTFSSLAFAFAVTNPTRPDRGTLGRMARTALRGRRDLSEIVQIVFSSVTDVIAERFRHPVVRDALHAAAGSTIPNSAPCTGVAFLWLSTMHRHTCRRPVGGVQAIPNALARRLAARGGDVLTSAPVAEITLQSGRACGVTLVDGRRIRARRAVLAACDPRTTLERLLPAGTLPPNMERRVQSIPTANGNYGQMKVDVALSGRLDMSRHNRWRRDGLDLRRASHMIGTEAGIERAFADSAAGLVPQVDDFSLWPVITTAADPSQAPDGQDSLYIYIATAPYAPKGGWEQNRDRAGQAIFRKASQFYGGLEDLEIGRQVLTNEDIAERVHATGGNVTHVDMVLGRAGPNRPARGFGGHRSPVEGLYLSGAGTHPGGGITGAPGYLVARAVLQSVHGRSVLGHRRETVPAIAIPTGGR
jgi:phytoene dehydrogenase-like protein